MSVQLSDTGITFSNGTVQTFAYTAGGDTGQLISITTYTSGTSTYVAPANCKTVLVRVQGGGGGSAGYCESGGAGGYAERLINFPYGSQEIVTVGGGGVGVAYYAAAFPGYTSSFGTWVTASGGAGANSQYNHTGGSGGVGGGGDVNLLGGGGTGHANHHNYGGMGRGGAGYYGSGNGVRHNYNQYVPGSSPGAGACGGCTDSGPNGQFGVAGAAGLVQIYAYT
jgi:hypothetical protein